MPHSGKGLAYLHIIEGDTSGLPVPPIDYKNLKRLFMNYAVWESVGAFKTTFENPEFRRHITYYPPSSVSRPHLFRKVSVPGIGVSG